MARWQPDARARLELAALDEFEEHGYERVTVARIAARAGLTERTFFRHYADKREVLFAGQDLLQALLVDATRSAADQLPPWAALESAFRRACVGIEERGELPLRRQHIVDSTQALRERELYKMDRIGRALADALVEAGGGEVRSQILAEAAVAAFKVAFERWIAAPATASRPQQTLAEHLGRCFAELPDALGAEAGTEH